MASSTTGKAAQRFGAVHDSVTNADDYRQGDGFYHCRCSDKVGKRCRKPFKSAVDLTRHEKTHYGSKELQCPHCPKAFGQKSHLTTHIRTHGKTEKFECISFPYCGNADRDGFCCTDYAQMRRHMRAHHTELFASGEHYPNSPKPFNDRMRQLKAEREDLAQPTAPAQAAVVDFNDFGTESFGLQNNPALSGVQALDMSRTLSTVSVDSAYGGSEVDPSPQKQPAEPCSQQQYGKQQPSLPYFGAPALAAPAFDFGEEEMDASLALDLFGLEPLGAHQAPAADLSSQTNGVFGQTIDPGLLEIAPASQTPAADLSSQQNDVFGDFVNPNAFEIAPASQTLAAYPGSQQNVAAGEMSASLDNYYTGQHFDQYASSEMNTTSQNSSWWMINQSTITDALNTFEMNAASQDNFSEAAIQRAACGPIDDNTWNWLMATLN